MGRDAGAFLVNAESLDQFHLFVLAQFQTQNGTRFF